MGFGRLRNKLARGEARVAGVLSGTSADGIDVVLVRPRAAPSRESRPDAGAPDRAGREAPGGGAADPPDRAAKPGASARGAGPGEGPSAPPEVLGFETLPFPPELGGRVRAVLDGRDPGLAGTARLHRDLGRAFGEAARAAAARRGLDLDLAGVMGQTVWHHDGAEATGPASLQLGDGDFAAEAAGCAVVSDFRQRDLAAGGEGAPIAALVDDELLAAAPRPCAVLNLGGIANLTLLGERGAPPRSFDTGPAGSLLDGLARRLLDRPYDDGGRAALGGRADAARVARWLEHPYFARPAPKSTGRDTFGERWVDELASAAASLAPADLLATAAAFVAAHVADALALAGPRPRALYVAGGGVHHADLMRRLAERAAVPVHASDRVGVDPDAREALAFALLAVRCVLGEPSTRPEATGARPGRVLGKLSPAPPAGESAEGA